MTALKKRMSHLENQVDACMEGFVFHHKFLGFLMIFVGMPLVTLLAVCICTMIVALPLSLAFGWV